MAGAGRRTFQPGEVLTASNVNSYLMDQAVMVFDDASERDTALGTAIVSEGMTAYLKDVDEIQVYDDTDWRRVFPSVANAGEIVQVVRAIDTTNRTITSTAAVDVTGMSVTITPKFATSKIIVLANCRAQIVATSGSQSFGFLSITDSSNVALSGAEAAVFGISTDVTHVQVLNVVGYAEPGVTSPVTYKLRAFTSIANRTITVSNGSSTGQIYAIEVVA